MNCYNRTVFLSQSGLRPTHGGPPRLQAQGLVSELLKIDHAKECQSFAVKVNKPSAPLAAACSLSELVARRTRPRGTERLLRIMLFALLGPFAFQLPRATTLPASRTALLRAAIPACVPSDKVAELSEPACLSTLSAIEMAQIELPPTLATGLVTATYARTSSPPAEGVPPVVLLHGFDSSCLEFRRLLPELETLGVEAYALDIFGWGFADTTNATGVGVDAKRAHLLSFQQTVLQGRPMTLVAVSLGAAVVVDFYSAHPEAVASTVLVDPQCMIDGTPPVPERFARTGIKVLPCCTTLRLHTPLGCTPLPRPVLGPSTPNGTPHTPLTRCSGRGRCGPSPTRWHTMTLTPSPPTTPLGWGCCTACGLAGRTTPSRGCWAVGTRSPRRCYTYCGQP